MLILSLGLGFFTANSQCPVIALSLVLFPILFLILFLNFILFRSLLVLISLTSYLIPYLLSLYFFHSIKLTQILFYS